MATQNKELRKRFKGKPEYVMNFMMFIAEEAREIMAELGFRTIDEMVGHTDCLKQRKGDFPVADKMDYASILDTTYASSPINHFNPAHVYNFKLEKTLDERVLIPALQHFKAGDHKEIDVKITSTDRTFATRLGSEVTKKFGNKLEEDSIVIKATGGAGQSVGAFLPKGVTVRVSGDANDGAGKGLSGGKIIIKPDDKAPFDPSENIIVGNVALYGATSGKAYFEGVAGERFCVRNSGATAISEGCGDHGLEYMTGGKAVILGHTGKNFAAGMSGGIAYVLDEDHTLYLKMNKDMVTMHEVTEKYDKQELRDLIEDYYKETGSKKAKMILDDFENYIPCFKKIVPDDYAKVIKLISHFEEQGISHENALMEAYQKVSREG